MISNLLQFERQLIVAIHLRYCHVMIIMEYYKRSGKFSRGDNFHVFRDIAFFANPSSHPDNKTF